MKLIDLLNVLDGDSKILIQQNRQEMFEGCAGDIVPARFSFNLLESKINAVWYSTTMNRIVIEC